MNRSKLNELLSECLKVYNDFYNTSCVTFLDSSECKRHLKGMVSNIANTIYTERIHNYKGKNDVALHDAMHTMDYIITQLN